MAANKRRAHVAERVREYSAYLVWEFDRGLARRVATADGGRRWLLDYARNWWHSRRNPHVTAILRSVLADVARDVRNELAGLEARLSTGTSVVPAKAPEAVRVLHRLSNAGQGEWVDGLATRYGLNWRLASADVSITREGVTVGDQLVRVWSLASAPGQVVGNCLDGLYGLNADLSVVLGWRGTDRQGARRRISSAQHHYHQARHSLMSAMGEGGEATGLEDFGAASEVQVLGQALVDLQSGDVCFGEMHLSVAVRAPGELEFAEINAALERVVGGIDGKVVRETHGLPPVWFGRLPGQTAVTPPRRFFVNSKLASALAPIVGPPRGHARCEHLDAEPLTTFETPWGTPYGYDLFGGGDVGHTLVLGATGSGKSFLLNFLLVQALKYDPRVLVLDLGRSYRYLTEFVGGRYLALAEGDDLDPSSAARMGLQPFGLPSTVRTRQFLAAWIERLLAIGQYACEADDVADLDKRVGEVFRRAPEKRTLSALAHLLPRRMWPAMSRWVDEGTWAPWFDGPPAELEAFGRWQVVDLAGASQHADWCEAALWFLLERMRLVMDDESQRGRLKILVVDEAWRYLKDAVVAAKLAEAAKTWRKMNGVIVATQSAGDVLHAAPELLESMPTRLLLANPSFPDEAARVLGLTPAEAATVRELEQKRELFIHRPGHSAVVRLEVDPESYWLYTSDPSDAVRRRAAVERWGLPGALMRLAAGVDGDAGGARADGGGSYDGQVREVAMRVVGCCVAALVLAAPTLGQEAERTPIRTVVASPTQPVVIFTRVRTVTTVRLPEGEEIVRTVAGDAENWDLVASGRELAVKPYAADLVSNVTVSCASGEVFTFTVVEDAGAAADYVVTVEAEEEEPALRAVDPAAVEVRYRPASAAGASASAWRATGRGASACSPRGAGKWSGCGRRPRRAGKRSCASSRPASGCPTWSPRRRTRSRSCCATCGRTGRSRT